MVCRFNIGQFLTDSAIVAEPYLMICMKKKKAATKMKSEIMITNLLPCNSLNG